MIANVDLDILKFMMDRDNYSSYKDYIGKGLCTKESWILINDFGQFFNEYPGEPVINSDFDLWFRVSGHPGWKVEEHAFYSTILTNVRARAVPDRAPFMDQLARIKFEQAGREALDSLSAGSCNPSDVLSILESLGNQSAQAGDQPCSFDLTALAADQRNDTGLFWRLEDLNKAVGPIRKGDFVVIAKRPEVGGTSFVCSELTHMVEQLKPGGKAIMFHNEEEQSKIITRLIGAACNVDYRTMMTAHSHWKQEYQTWLDGRTLDLIHSTNMTVGSVNRQLRGAEYDLIVINVLLKVGGTSKKEDHDKFQALGEEMRRIAQEHGPVLAVVQADPSAEGVQYIPQDRIYKSKTALQGEADVLIMIGASEIGPVDSRYIHVAKNKIPPAPCCDLTKKHIKSEVRFDIGTGRFETLNFKGVNSRCVKSSST